MFGGGFSKVMITFIWVSTRDLVLMGAICRRERPRGAPDAFGWAEGVAPFMAGEGVKCRLPGELNWLP